MTAEIVELDVITSLKIPVEKVLHKALEADLEEVVVIGWTKEGDFEFRSSSPDGGDVLWLLELTKKKLLEAEV